MKYIAYCRVSTNTQRLGISAQKLIIQEYLSYGDVLLHIIEEVASASKHNRKELNKAINLSSELDATLLVTNADRLSRKRYFVSKLFRNGLKLSIIDLPNATHSTILDAVEVAEQEAIRISRRTKESLMIYKDAIDDNGFFTTKNGKVKTKLGSYFTKETSLKGLQAQKEMWYNHPNAVKARAFASALRSSGYSIRLITIALNKNGYRGARDGKFYWTSTKNLLDSNKYQEDKRQMYA